MLHVEYETSIVQRLFPIIAVAGWRGKCAHSDELVRDCLVTGFT